MKTLKILAALLLSLSVSQSTLAWGKWGHAISAYIAEQHLTEKANSECQRYLKHSLPYFASWQDHWRYCDGFEEVCTAHAHYVNVDFSLRGKGSPDRDPVTRIDKITREMEKGQYKNMPDSIVAMNIKLLIHMVADMHCPGHITYHPDSNYPVKMKIGIKGKPMARHKFWDNAPAILHPKWKLERFCKEYDTYTDKQIKKICKGTPYKWGDVAAREMVKTFDYWKDGQSYKSLSKEKREAIENLTHETLAVGGYRLAAVLNRIFK